MKKFLSVFAAMASVAALSLGFGLTADAAPAGKPIVLKFAHHQQPDSPAGLACQRLAERIMKKSDGRIEVRVFPAEQLGNEKSVFEQLASGTVDLSTFGFGIIGSRSPSSLAMEMGYMFENYDHLVKFLDSDVFGEIVQDAVGKARVRIGGAYYNGTRHTTTSKAPVTDPASMRGVKLRVPNSEMLLATFKAMGCAPTPMAFSEVYMALQNGTIDGQENPIPTIVAMRFYEVQKYLCLTAHMVQAATFTASQKSLDKLPEDLRAIVLEEMKEEANVTSAEVLKREVDELELLKQKGMEVVETDNAAFKAEVEKIIPTFETKWGVGLYARIQATK